MSGAHRFFLPSFDLSRAVKEGQTLVVTVSLALLSGWLLSQLRLPAPYMLGALLGVWGVGTLCRPIQPWLGVPRWFHVPVVLGLGVIVGAAIGPGFLQSLQAWWLTALVLLLATLAASALGFLFLWRLRGRSWLQALLSAIPGGQTEISLIARRYLEKDYAVMLVHLVRVSFIFLSTPLLLAVLESAGKASGSAVAASVGRDLPGLLDLPPLRLLEFLGLAVGGFLVARGLRVPMPHLLGPMLFSLLFTAAGWVETPQPAELVLLAQITIGGQVGARLSQLRFSQVVPYLLDGVYLSFITLSFYALAAMLVAAGLGLSFIETYLAFVPGGLYEVTLLALLFGLDVAFIAFHSTLRVVLIYLALPLLVSRSQRSQRDAQPAAERGLENPDQRRP